MRNACLFAALGAVPAAAAGLGVGCSSRSQPAAPQTVADSQTGSLGAALQIAGGITINTVSYTLLGPNGFVATGTVDVSHSAGLSFVVGGLPAGGYTLSLSATSTDGETTCAGSAVFRVVAGMTSNVSVHLVCHQESGAGSANVGASGNICPVIDGLGASPSEVEVGGTIALTSTAHDPDNGPLPLSYQWTATSGMFDNTSAQNPVFTCTAPGTVTIKLTVSDGDPSSGCPASMPISVQCDAPTADAGPCLVLPDPNQCLDTVITVTVPGPDGGSIKNTIRGLIEIAANVNAGANAGDGSVLPVGAPGASRCQAAPYDCTAVRNSDGSVLLLPPPPPALDAGGTQDAFNAWAQLIQFKYANVVTIDDAGVAAPLLPGQTQICAAQWITDHDPNAPANNDSLVELYEKLPAYGGQYILSENVAFLTAVIKAAHQICPTLVADVPDGNVENAWWLPEDKQRQFLCEFITDQSTVDGGCSGIAQPFDGGNAVNAKFLLELFDPKGAPDTGAMPLELFSGDPTGGCVCINHP